MCAEIHVRELLRSEMIQNRRRCFNKGAVYMADKFWMRCGLLVCGVAIAAMVPAYAEPVKPTGQAGHSLAISGKVIMASNLAGKGSPTDTLFVFARETSGPP